jgi:hypothetical protein
MAYLNKYLIKVGDAFSQMLNVVFLNGHPNESLSGRAWRTKSIWAKIIDFILWFDKEHCQKSHENDLDYARTLLKE